MKQKLVNSSVMYAFGMLAMMIPSQAFSIYYTFYYVDELGLAAGLAAIARTVFLIWDALNQPLFGYWSDRTRTRFGRRRPWILGAIPLFMLTFILVFSPPSSLSQHGLFVWFLVMLVLYEAVATVLWVNYGALFPELFKGDKLRGKASAVQNGFQIVGLLIASAVAPILIKQAGYSYMTMIFAGFLRENPEAAATPQLKFVEAFKLTLGNRPFWIVNIANSFAQTVNGLLGAMIPFYAKYVLHIPLEQNTLLLASIFVSVIPLVAVWFWLMEKIKNPVRSWRLSFLAYALSVIPLWFSTDLLSGILAGVLVGFGLAGFLVTPVVVNSTIIDEDFVRTGSRREGIYTAVGGFITRSSGFISALVFFLISLAFHYKSGDDPGTNPALTFKVLISAVPFILLAISFIISLFVKFERTSGHERQP
jgi:glycoside/pentoside/hexuronide:cation symporter, GPH family